MICYGHGEFVTNHSLFTVEDVKKRKSVEPSTSAAATGASAKKKSKEGFARGLEAERIVGATDAGGEKNLSLFNVSCLQQFSPNRRAKVPHEMEGRRRSRPRSSQTSKRQVPTSSHQVL